MNRSRVLFQNGKDFAKKVYQKVFVYTDDEFATTTFRGMGVMSVMGVQLCAFDYFSGIKSSKDIQVLDLLSSSAYVGMAGAFVGIFTVPLIWISGMIVPALLPSYLYFRWNEYKQNKMRALKETDANNQ
jgi:hypothetical protein